MTRLALTVAIAALAFASSALALGGSHYAQISANWGTPGNVDVIVVSNHSFRGDVENACVATAGGVTHNTDETHPLDSWFFNPVAHQYEDKTSFGISAAGAGANCTITVLDGHKVLAQQQYVSN